MGALLALDKKMFAARALFMLFVTVAITSAIAQDAIVEETEFVQEGKVTTKGPKADENGGKSPADTASTVPAAVTDKHDDKTDPAGGCTDNQILCSDGVCADTCDIASGAAMASDKKGYP